RSPRGPGRAPRGPASAPVLAVARAFFSPARPPLFDLGAAPPKPPGCPGSYSLSAQWRRANVRRRVRAPPHSRCYALTPTLSERERENDSFLLKGTQGMVFAHR